MKSRELNKYFEKDFFLLQLLGNVTLPLDKTVKISD